MQGDAEVLVRVQVPRTLRFGGTCLQGCLLVILFAVLTYAIPPPTPPHPHPRGRASLSVLELFSLLSCGSHVWGWGRLVSSSAQ